MVNIQKLIKRYGKISTFLYSVIVFHLLWKEKNPQHEPKWWLFALPHFDKVVHCAIFTIWTILFLLSFPRKIFVLLSFLFFLAWTTELGQFLFTKTRSFDLLDIIADLVGVLFGYLFVRIWNNLLYFNSK